MSLRDILQCVSSTVATRISSVMREAYMPPCLCPGGEAAADALHGEYADAILHGYQVMRNVMRDSAEQGATSPGLKLSASETKKNILALSEQFAASAKRGDPDALAAKLVELFCIGLAEMGVQDNRRRIVATWSAILAPQVVMREKTACVITLQSIVDAGADWLSQGYTAAARDAYTNGDTRFIAAHPARMYQLVSDAAHKNGLNHPLLMASLIKPVAIAIGCHVGACRAAAGEDAFYKAAMEAKAGAA